MNIRQQYFDYFTALGCDCVIGGKSDVYFFSLVDDGLLRFVVRNNSIKSVIIGLNLEIDVIQVCPIFTEDFYSYIRLLPLSSAYEQISESGKHYLSEWINAYSEEYSFNAFKKAVSQNKECTYVIPCDNYVGTYPNVDNIDSLDLSYVAGSDYITLSMTVEQKSIQLKINDFLLIENEVELLHPYTDNNIIRAVYRKKRITQILDNV